MDEKVFKSEQYVHIKGTSISGVIRGKCQIDHPNGTTTNEYVVSIREVNGEPTRGTMWNGYYLSRLVVSDSMLEEV